MRRSRSACVVVAVVVADGAGSTGRLPRRGSQGRVLDGRLIIGGKRELDEAVEILEDLGVPLDAGLPILVDASLQGGLSLGNLGGVRRRVVVVEGVGGDVVKMGRVGRLSSLGELTEILENVVLGMGPDPGTMIRTS